MDGYGNSLARTVLQNRNAAVPESPKALLFRKGLMLVLIEAVMLGIAFTSDMIDTDRPEVVFVIMGSVLVIFVLANLFLWLKDAAEAKKLNTELEQYQKLYE